MRSTTSSLAIAIAFTILYRVLAIPIASNSRMDAALQGLHCVVGRYGCGPIRALNIQRTHGPEPDETLEDFFHNSRDYVEEALDDDTLDNMSYGSIPTGLSSRSTHPLNGGPTSSSRWPSPILGKAPPGQPHRGSQRVARVKIDTSGYRPDLAIGIGYGIVHVGEGIVGAHLVHTLECKEKGHCLDVDRHKNDAQV